MGIPVLEQLLKDIEASDRRGKENPTRSQILLLLCTQGTSCTKDEPALPTGHLHPCDGHCISEALTLQSLLN